MEAKLDELERELDQRLEKLHGIVDQKTKEYNKAEKTFQSQFELNNYLMACANYLERDRGSSASKKQ